MSPIIENLPNIAKDIEIFYMSSIKTMTLDIKLLPPVNQILYLTVYKLSSYQETVNNVIARIKLYLSQFSKLTLINNGIKQNVFFSNAQDRNNYINICRSQQFKSYLTKNPGFSGKIEFS